jgi:hypothetical protein
MNESMQTLANILSLLIGAALFAILFAAILATLSSANASLAEKVFAPVRPTWPHATLAELGTCG